MANFFHKILTGIEDAAKWAVKAITSLPKLITDVQKDADSVLPATIKLVDDVEQIVVTGGKDAAAFLAASKLLWPALIAAVAADCTNLTLDAEVVSLAQGIVTNGKEFQNVIPLFETLFTDYETFAKDTKAALEQLEVDVANL